MKGGGVAGAYPSIMAQKVGYNFNKTSFPLIFLRFIFIAVTGLLGVGKKKKTKKKHVKKPFVQLYYYYLQNNVIKKNV